MEKPVVFEDTIRTFFPFAIKIWLSHDHSTWTNAKPKATTKQVASWVVALDKKFPFTPVELGLCPIRHLWSFEPTTTIFISPVHVWAPLYTTVIGPLRPNGDFLFSFLYWSAYIQLLICLENGKEFKSSIWWRWYCLFFFSSLFRLVQGSPAHSKMFWNMDAQLTA